MCCGGVLAHVLLHHDLSADVKEAGSMSCDDDGVPLVGPHHKKVKSDEALQFALLIGSLLAGLASRLRALEAALYFTWRGNVDNPIMLEKKEVGVKHDKRAKAVVASGKKYVLPCAIHIVQWLAAFDKVHSLMPPGENRDGLKRYVDWARLNEIVSEEVRYFRGFHCFDKQFAKLICRVETPVISVGREATHFVQPLLEY